jgi:hypothetical protein
MSPVRRQGSRSPEGLRQQHVVDVTGHTRNGHMLNGHMRNGHTRNGHMRNGHMRNGHMRNASPYAEMVHVYGFPIISEDNMPKA